MHDQLAPWYAVHGRHHLPWRHTRDPWAVLVSEVMLQQTGVTRVLPRWTAFIDRWPRAGLFAVEPLAEVLRFWQGLGYPRRARALHETAAIVAVSGWPHTEGALRALPGVGRYTARALLTLAFERPSPAPVDVNVARVTSRAELGTERAGAAELDAALVRSRPRTMTPRDHTLALFDAGALHCRAVPRCDGCPFAMQCRSRGRHFERTRTHSAKPYGGSFRQLRGAVLRALLDSPPPGSLADVGARIGRDDVDSVRSAAESLAADGLIAAVPPGDTRL